MSRLTERDEYGNADIVGVDSEDLQLNLDFDGLNLVTDALNKLADYEDAEEEGTLVRLHECEGCAWYHPKFEWCAKVKSYVDDKKIGCSFYHGAAEAAKGE